MTYNKLVEHVQQAYRSEEKLIDDIRKRYWTGNDHDK
jgi:hypothetical protein